MTEHASHAKLVAAHKAFLRCEEDAKSLREDRADVVKSYVEREGINMDAFKMVRKLAAMDSVKREAWLRAFDAYADEVSLRSQPDLFSTT